MMKNIQFQYLSKSWVAINPNPRGIIQFIGSFVFGSFPINSYKFLFKNLFERGYTIIVFRFPFNPLEFAHWKVATKLIKQEYNLRVEIIKKLTQEGNLSSHNLEIYLNDANYYWLGHSLGCKYISLLEILSNDPTQRESIIQNALGSRYDETLKPLIKSVDEARKCTEQKISELLAKPINIGKFFIKDQPSILLAPEVSNTVTVNGVTIPTANPLPNLELLVRPNARETKCMIAQSKDLFNLTGMISFAQDCIAKDDVTFFIQQLHQRDCYFLHQELSGWHFEPNGIQVECLTTIIDRFFKKLRQRQNDIAGTVTN
ncbi:MAG: DUF1350 family protein [Xenococcaceae cyanobacterium]